MIIYEATENAVKDLESQRQSLEIDVQRQQNKADKIGAAVSQLETREKNLRNTINELQSEKQEISFLKVDRHSISEELKQLRAQVVVI